MTRRYHFGLVGHNISYTLSPRIFEALTAIRGEEAMFEVADVPPEDLENKLRTMREWDGFSVTVPYKRTIMLELSKISPEADEIGAVNSVRVTGGEFHGYNTDAEAFIAPLRKITFAGKRFLVLGNGGAAAAVVWALSREYPEAAITVCGRDENKVRGFIERVTRRQNMTGEFRGLNYQSLVDEAEFDLIVNGTPLGGANYANTAPLPENFRFENCAVCYDLNYRPKKTLLMARAEKAGCHIIGGLAMLIRQAALSYAVWTGCELDIDGVSDEITGLLGVETKGGAK